MFLYILLMMSGYSFAGWVMLVDILLMMGGDSSTGWVMLIDIVNDCWSYFSWIGDIY